MLTLTYLAAACFESCPCHVGDRLVTLLGLFR